jgi:hypothetical protein
MARTAKRARPVAIFTHSIKFEVHRSKFTLLESARHLDTDRLARAASAEVELGFLEGGCCQRYVRAVLRKGMVTKLALEPCAERPPMKISPELAGLLKVAGHRIRQRRRRAPRLPLAVQDFMSNLQAVAEETIYCIHLCFLGHCIWCCFYWEGDAEPSWGYLDCEGWIVGPFPPSREARSRSVRRGGGNRSGAAARLTD